MLTKSFVLVAIALGVLLSVGASWGVATLASSHTVSAPYSAATGVPGITGTDGKNGNDGEAGTNGAAGALGPVGAQGPVGIYGAAGARGAVGAQGPAGTNGAAGALGPVGAQGLAGTNGAAGALGAVGAQGPAGATGSSGASAPTFSAISASGVAFSGVGGTYTGTYTFTARTATVPIGKALVGFSVSLIGHGSYSLFGGTCSLVDTNTSRAYARASIPNGPDAQSYTFRDTEFVNLLSPAVLTVKCGIPYLDPQDRIDYDSMSVYAISFAQ